MSHREFAVRCPDGTTHRVVLEDGRMYAMDGLPWHVVLTVAKLVEVTTPPPTVAESGGWKVTEANCGGGHG